jgi:hypothetical protein
MAIMKNLGKIDLEEIIVKMTLYKDSFVSGTEENLVKRQHLDSLIKNC